MKIRVLIDECKRIITKPLLAWQEITEKQHSLKNIYFSFLLPLLVCLPIASLLGNFVFNPLFRKTVSTILISSTSQIFILFFNIYFTSFFTCRIIKIYQGKSTKANIHRLIVYSSIAYILASIAAAMLENYHSLIVVCQLFGIYSIYLINIGLPYLVDIQTEKRIPFVASIILIAIACNLLLKYVVTILLQLL